MNTSYNKADKVKVFKLRSKGKTYQQIADKMNIPLATIGLWIRLKMQDSPRSQKLLKPRYRITSYAKAKR